MAIREHTFVITVAVDASKRATCDHIKDAVECWGGQYHPDDPFFNLRRKVKINIIKKEQA
jgi:hypothetical protein